MATKDDRPAGAGADEEIIYCGTCTNPIGTAPRGDQVAAQRVKNNHTCPGKP